MIDAIIKRLRDECSGLAAVDDPTRIQPLDRESYPVATVHLASSVRAESRLSAGTSESLRIEIRITAQTGAQLEASRKEIAGALEGHIPTGAQMPLSFTAGEMLQLSGPLCQWRDVYQITSCLV
jgi:hypothetical protein